MTREELDKRFDDMLEDCKRIGYNAAICEVLKIIGTKDHASTELWFKISALYKYMEDKNNGQN